MKIALDFDDTYTRDTEFWSDFIELCKLFDHDVRIVTFRKKVMTDPRLTELTKRIPVIYTEYTQKRPYCEAIEWIPDVWIDDSPEYIVAHRD